MNDPLPTGPPHPAPRRRRRVLSAAVAAVAVALVAGVFVAHDRSTTTASRPRGDGVTVATVGAPAPNGIFTTANGTRETIASLRGHATLVWFVAGGCASCAASIPTVARHLTQLQDKGVQVLTLGLYGAFEPGERGAAQLAAFGRVAAGANVTRPGWTWAMPSEALSIAYDPSGIPDEYFLVNPAGTITYHNSVPVSTMARLLAAAGITARHTTAAASEATTATLP